MLDIKDKKDTFEPIFDKKLKPLKNQIGTLATQQANFREKVEKSNKTKLYYYTYRYSLKILGLTYRLLNS